MDAHEIRNLSALVEATKRADDMRFHEQANSSFGFPRKCWAVPVVVFGQNMKVRYFEIILKSIEYFGLVGGRKLLQIN